MYGHIYIISYDVVIYTSENSQSQSSMHIEMYSMIRVLNTIRMKWVFVGRDIQLMKDYTTGNATFKQGSRGTVIDATSRKDRKWKVKFNNMIYKKIQID